MSVEEHGGRRVLQEPGPDGLDRLEARYLRGLRVRGDMRLKAFANALLYAWGAMVWWMLAPAVPLYGWRRVVAWAASFVLAYLSLRSLAVFYASWQWLRRLELARRVPHGAGRVDLAGRRRAELASSPLSRIRARRISLLWRPRP